MPMSRRAAAAERLSELRAALDSEEWERAKGILEGSWAILVGDHIEHLREALIAFPESVIDENPTLRAGREMLVGWGATARFPGPLPKAADELENLGGSAKVSDALIVGTVQACLLRFAGMYTPAAELAGRLEQIALSAVSAQPDVVAASVPVLRLQWAVTCQLAGRHPEAIGLFRLAYFGARAVGIEFVLRNAAGSLALLHALSGDLPAARKWLARRDQTSPSTPTLEPMVRVSGLVAQILISLEGLDVEAAAEASRTLGELGDNEELWAYVVYARSQLALLSGHAQEGLDRLGQVVAVNERWYTSESDAVALLRSVSVDLHCALGRGNSAGAVLQDRSVTRPMLEVSRGRFALLTEDPDAALTEAIRITARSGGTDQRVLAEALLVEAAASIRLGKEQGAVDAVQRATMLAERSGSIRPFALLTQADTKELAAAGASFPPAWGEEGFADRGAVFPDVVALVDLSAREQVVIVALADGLTLPEMAAKQFVSQNTVKTQMRSLFRKLGVHSRDEAVREALRLHLL